LCAYPYLMERGRLSSKKRAILVAEDEPDNLSLFVRLLEGQGYHVVGVCDAAQAVKVLNNGSVRIDVLVTDNQLPGMTGVALAQYAKRTRPKIRVVGISALARLIKPLDSPFDGLLQKPVRARKLLGEVKRLFQA
ncbi:MAG: response regulator, partial [Elusimicrobia bacterium]|nr:response regulator [Elusimicrobiota bacterium]